MPILTLNGCPPEPLGNYLKAIGVFRLVAEQADPTARAWWEGGVLRLLTRLDERAIQDFFLGGDPNLPAYQPTPIFAPWGGRPGFYRKDSNADARSRLLRLKVARKAGKQPLKARRQLNDAALTLAVLGRVLSRHREWDAKKKGEDRPWLEAKKAKKDKERLIRACRNTWPQRAVEWLDACLAVGDDLDFGSLFGTGGNEGSADITNSFWQFVEDCIGFPEPKRESPEWLANALFSSPRTSGSGSSAGQHFPAAAQGENIGQRFTGAISANPWDVVLAMEGSVLFAGAITKRLSQVGRGKAAFPFMLEHVASDSGPESAHDELKQDVKSSKCKAEFWMPLWQQPLVLSELRGLLSEGRMQTPQGSPAEHSIQALEAIATLGVSAGVSAFRRVGLFERRGNINIAATLEEVPVPRRAAAAISALAELSDFRRLSQVRLRAGAGAPERVLTAKHLLEVSVARVARRGCLGVLPSREDLQAILSRAAELERECSLTRSIRAEVNPCGVLSRRWLDVDDPACCLDASAECGIALAIASLSAWGEDGTGGHPVVGSLRTNLVPVSRRGNDWQWNDQSRSDVWSKGAPLLTNLATVLLRRLVEAQRGSADGLPLWSFRGALFRDLLALWQSGVDESRLADLIRALALVDFGKANCEDASHWQITQDPTPSLAQSGVWFEGDAPRLSLGGEGLELPEDELEAAFALPRAYALLKLCFVG
jgi:CRISPR-associated protein Csx17